MKDINQKPDAELLKGSCDIKNEYPECSVKDCKEPGTMKVPVENTISRQQGYLRVCREHSETLKAAIEAIKSGTSEWYDDENGGD